MLYFQQHEMASVAMFINNETWFIIVTLAFLEYVIVHNYHKKQEHRRKTIQDDQEYQVGNTCNI
jgi:hypothetical protein